MRTRAQKNYEKVNGLALKWKGDFAKCGPFEASVSENGAGWVYGMDATGSIEWSDEHAGGVYSRRVEAQAAAEVWLRSTAVKMLAALSKEPK